MDEMIDKYIQAPEDDSLVLKASIRSGLENKPLPLQQYLAGICPYIGQRASRNSTILLSERKMGWRSFGPSKSTLQF